MNTINNSITQIESRAKPEAETVVDLKAGGREQGAGGWELGLGGLGAGGKPPSFSTKARPTAGASALTGSSIVLRSELTSAYPPHPRQSPLSQLW